MMAGASAPYPHRELLAVLWEVEVRRFRAARPQSERLFQQAKGHMADGVPML